MRHGDALPIVATLLEGLGVQPGIRNGELVANADGRKKN